MEEQHHGQRIWQWLLEGKRHSGAKHTLHFKPFLYIMKTIILPRLARDKQTVENQRRFPQDNGSHFRKAAQSVRKTHLLQYHFILKMIISPRQDRDKHRESTQKERRECTRFSQVTSESLTARSSRHLHQKRSQLW
jgi:hypothetical protein